MAARDEIVSFCDELLDQRSFSDYCPNGLQIPGSAEVGHVATAVSAHLETLERAIEGGAELLLCHHGLIWDSQPRGLSEPMAARLRAALGAGLSVAGYHLPLDAHPEIGNNALLCSELGFERDPVPFYEVKGTPIGAVGRSAAGIAPDELAQQIANLLGRDPLVFADGPDQVRSLGIVSGGGAAALGEAIALGLDAFLTGEPAEPVMAEAREGGVHFIAAGHYATERFGIRRLGELVAERFGVEHSFIDAPNPV